MSIIPISPDKVLVHKNDDGTEIHFRYLTGEYRAKYHDLQEMLLIKAKPYFEKAGVLAKKQISELKKSLKKQGTKKKTVPTLERLTAQVALMLAKSDGAITSGDEDRQTSAYIDLFVVGWKGPGFIPKKVGVPASEYFTPTATTEIMDILSSHIHELMGLSIQDQKN